MQKTSSGEKVSSNRRLPPRRASVPNSARARINYRIGSIREKIMMRKLLPAVVIVIATSITLSASLHSEEKFQRLNGQQIRAKIAGMEFTDQSHWGEVFEPNGILKSFSMGHRTMGKWRVQKDQLCLERGSEPGGGCYEVWLAGKKVELRNQIADAPLEGVLEKPTDR